MEGGEAEASAQVFPARLNRLMDQAAGSHQAELGMRPARRPRLRYLVPRFVQEALRLKGVERSTRKTETGKTVFSWYAVDDFTLLTITFLKWTDSIFAYIGLTHFVH